VNLCKLFSLSLSLFVSIYANVFAALQVTLLLRCKFPATSSLPLRCHGNPGAWQL